MIMLSEGDIVRNAFDRRFGVVILNDNRLMIQVNKNTFVEINSEWDLYNVSK